MCLLSVSLPGTQFHEADPLPTLVPLAHKKCLTRYNNSTSHLWSVSRLRGSFVSSLDALILLGFKMSSGSGIVFTPIYR